MMAKMRMANMTSRAICIRGARALNMDFNTTCKPWGQKKACQTAAYSRKIAKYYKSRNSVTNVLEVFYKCGLKGLKHYRRLNGLKTWPHLNWEFDPEYRISFHVLKTYEFTLFRVSNITSCYFTIQN